MSVDATIAMRGTDHVKSTLPGVKLRFRLLTALDLLLSIATIAWVNSRRSWHNFTNRRHALRNATH